MKTIEIIALSILAVFAPIAPVLVAALVLVVIDLCTGIVAAYKRGDKITSQGLKRSLMKLVLYQIAIMTAFLAEHYLIGDFFPMTKLVTSMVGLTEAKSVLENLDSISGSSLFQSIIGKLSRQTTANQEGKDEKTK